jgi:hypothetical protein
MKERQNDVDYSSCRLNGRKFGTEASFEQTLVPPKAKFEHTLVPLKQDFLKNAWKMH